ncbi:MAG: hypothetical protein JOZ13_13215 [Alphaproteobacteria bacterium]|nr:hypothetical protein [Alphaproteobacteria bacterium]
MSGMEGTADTGLLGSYPMTRDSSGTSWQPDASAHAGIHSMLDGWSIMAHATLWGIYDSQSGPRGDTMIFAPGMLMVSARRDLDPSNTLNFRVMLSPDPFMGRRGYPLLLASGETANGTTPLVDHQHPHDLFMELSGTYSHDFTQEDSAFLYLGYPGEPALGPSAFMHRVSSMDIPEAPITHHWMDSTHVTFGVATAGFVHDDWKIEVSQFTGREPDQYRFDFDQPRFDSTSVRLTWNPDAHWSLQTSWGHLNSPEQLTPSVNENRVTASATYFTPLGDGSSFAATLGWGLKDLSDGAHLNGLLLEAEYKPARWWTTFARAEWEQNNELSASGTVHDVGELTLGGIRDWPIAPQLAFGLGASYTYDFVSTAIIPSYGSDPHGLLGFARLTLD